MALDCRQRPAPVRRIVATMSARAAVLALFVVAVQAQDRGVCVGRVSAADGKPMAGATVYLTTPLAAHALLAEPERIIATTDAQGTFRAELRLGRNYGVGAVGPQLADGTAAVSEVRRGVGVGEFVALTLSAPSPAPSLRVHGLDRWGDDAPRRARIRLRGAPGIAHEVALAPTGPTHLPHLPTDAACLELLTADGSTLWWCHLAPPAPDGRFPDCELPEPVPVRFTVRATDGTPIAGVSIERRAAHILFDRLGLLDQFVTESWPVLGHTGADGTLTARIPNSTEDWLRVFRAGKPGFATDTAALCGTSPVQVIDARGDGDANAREVHFELLPEQLLCGTVIREPGAPLADTELLVEMTRLLPLPKGGSVQVPMLHRVRTNAAGAWTLTQAPAYADLPRVLTPVTLSRPDGAQLPPVLVEATGRTETMPAVVLSTLRSFDLQVTRADGGPAMGAVVVVLPLDRRRWFVETWDARHRLDRAGRARVCPPPGEALLFCTDGREFAELHVEASTGNSTLRMVPLTASSLRIRTAAGEAAVAALLSLQSYSPPVNETDPLRQARGAIAVSLHAATMDGLRTDARGMVTVHSVPDSGTTQRFRIEHAGTETEVSCVPGDQDVTMPAAK